MIPIANLSVNRTTLDILSPRREHSEDFYFSPMESGKWKYLQETQKHNFLDQVFLEQAHLAWLTIYFSCSNGRSSSENSIFCIAKDVSRTYIYIYIIDNRIVTLALYLYFS